ncbi:MAG: cytochrome c [Acidimicrobiales bacterium]|nr:cytochrome c [Acidimicrobiales bacterium]
MRRRTFVGVGVGVAAVLLGACGGEPEPPLSAEGQQGKEVAGRYGCTSCHSSNGRSGIGPTWLEAWGSEVELSDGSTVTFDDAYAEQAIRDPGSQVVDGYRNIMPTVGLSDEEIALVVAYLRDLGQPAG